GGRDPGPAAPSHDPGAATAVSQFESVFVGVPALAGASAEDRLKAVLQRRQTETRPVRGPGAGPKKVAEWCLHRGSLRHTPLVGRGGFAMLPGGRRPGLSE